VWQAVHHVGALEIRAAVVDSTGSYFNPMLRHLDRGSQEVGQRALSALQYVFGANRRRRRFTARMIETFRSTASFFRFRFLSCTAKTPTWPWRAQLMGWKCCMCPTRAVYHGAQGAARQAAARRRRINMHSVKNASDAPERTFRPICIGGNWFSITGRDIWS